MKRSNKLKFLCLALSALMLVPQLAGCKDDPSQETSDTAQTSTVGTVTLNDFSTAKDLYLISTATTFSFGALNINTDKNYVLTGETSAKLEPRLASSDAGLKQRLISTSKGYNYADLSRARMIETKIYNDSDRPILLETELEFSNKSKSLRSKTTLEPKTWTTVRHKINTAILGINNDLKEGMYFNMYFKKNQAVSNPTLYMEDITLDFSEYESDPIVQTIDENEFCSFDKNYQGYIMELDSWTTTFRERVPEMSLCANPAYTVNGTGNSFKVRTLKGTTRWAEWYYLKFSTDYCARAGLNKVKNTDKLQLSIYNDGPADSFAAEIYCKVQTPTAGEQYLKINTSFSSPTYSKNDATHYWKMEANKWNTLELDFGLLEEQALLQIKAAYDMDEYDVLGNLTRIFFTWGEFVDCNEKTFYIDEIKFIRGE